MVIRTMAMVETTLVLLKLIGNAQLEIQQLHQFVLTYEEMEKSWFPQPDIVMMCNTKKWGKVGSQCSIFFLKISQ